MISKLYRFSYVFRNVNKRILWLVLICFVKCLIAKDFTKVVLFAKDFTKVVVFEKRYRLLKKVLCFSPGNCNITG
jgi:transposase